MLEMEADLLRDRGFTCTNSTPAMRFFFLYSKYRKDREEQAKARQRQRHGRLSRTA